MDKADKRICVGVIVGAHGVRGQVKLVSYTDDPESLFEYKPLTDATGAQKFSLTCRGVGKDHFIASLRGVTTREEAQALKGTKLYVARDALPESEEGEYYYSDLIGLCAQEAQGATVGEVIDVHDYGAGTFLEIKPIKGKSFMLPFKDAFVPVVDLAKGFVQVEIPDGWLAADKPPKEKQEKKERAKT